MEEHPFPAPTVEYEGKKVAIFEIDGCRYAIDNKCPHRGAPLSRGDIEDTSVRCPVHGWLFDLKTGKCLNQPSAKLTAYEVSGDVESPTLIPIEVEPETPEV